MKKMILIISLLIAVKTIHAQQTCDCTQELQFVYEKIQETASFKSQIKGDKRIEFEQHYLLIQANVQEDMPIQECFWQLQEFKTFIADYHMEIYQVRPSFNLEDIRDSAFVSNYRQSTEFIHFPKYEKDLEELKLKLAEVPNDSIEGVYTVGQNVMKVGLFQYEKTGKYLGVILESNLRIWEPGQIYISMKEVDKANRIYDIMTYGQVHKNLIYRNNWWVKPNVLFSNVKKDTFKPDYSRASKNKEEAYQLLALSNDVQYVWFDSFSRIGNETRRDALIDQIRDELVAPNLIIDLRDNTGGASKISLPILKAIKKHGNPKIYLITNYNSISNAEQTTMRLLKDERTVHLGERTRGAVAYGMNYGYTFDSPSGLFRFIPTDMKFNQWLSYEEVGVEPAISLDHNSDWIDQTLEVINGMNL